MREYLFRGKTRYGCWVYGSLIHVDDFCCILEADDKNDYDYPYLDPVLGIIDGNVTPVIPETVGQFTGVCDKNGKRIFEDDFFIYPRRSDSVMQTIYRVIWDNKQHGFYAREVWCNFKSIPPDYDYLGNFFNGKCELVGNVHDNPELLRGEYNV